MLSVVVYISSYIDLVFIGIKLTNFTNGGYENLGKGRELEILERRDATIRISVFLGYCRPIHSRNTNVEGIRKFEFAVNSSVRLSDLYEMDRWERPLVPSKREGRPSAVERAIGFK